MSVLVLMLGAGGLFFYTPGLSSLRPSGASQATPRRFAEEDLPGSLWEDPFTAVQRGRALSPAREAPPSSTVLGLLRERLSGGSAEVAHDVVAPHSLDELRRGIRRRLDAAPDARDPLVLMPVFVPGGGAAENVEKRRRIRYAVLSAMGMAQLVPESTDHIGYVDIRWDDAASQVGGRPLLASRVDEAAAPESGAGEAPRATISMPYEWLRRDRFVPGTAVRKTPHAVVLWLAEGDWSRDPLGMLTQVLERVLPDDRDHVQVKLLGPATSGGMLDLLGSSERAAAVRGPVTAAKAAPEGGLAATLRETFVADGYDAEMIDVCLEVEAHTWTGIETVAMSLRREFLLEPLVIEAGGGELTWAHLRLIQSLLEAASEAAYEGAGEAAPLDAALTEWSGGQGQADDPLLDAARRILEETAPIRTCARAQFDADEDGWMTDPDVLLLWTLSDWVSERLMVESRDATTPWARRVRIWSAWLVEELAFAGVPAEVQDELFEELVSELTSREVIPDTWSSEFADTISSVASVFEERYERDHLTANGDAPWGPEFEEYTLYMPEWSEQLVRGFLYWYARSLRDELTAYLDDPEPVLQADDEVFAALKSKTDQLFATGASTDREPLIEGLAELIVASFPTVRDSDPMWALSVSESFVRARAGSRSLHSVTQSASLVPARDLIEIYSTRSTTSPRQLGFKDDGPADGSGAIEDEGQEAAAASRTAEDKLAARVTELLTGRSDGASRFHFVSVGDDALAGALVEEFWRRGMGELGDQQPLVVLVGEWDTIYGRVFPQELEGALAASTAARQAQAGAGDLPGLAPSVVEVSYVRGLDGARPGDDPGAAVQTVSTSEQESLEYPVGRSQLDYLRRLEVQLAALEGSDHDSKVFAIGVVGTDLYDKQLILHALRDDFPGTLFFTTDLDARLLHPSQYFWSRNLIVASGFGLELGAELQSRYPPFRDAYQTATYLAGLLALGVSVPLPASEARRLAFDHSGEEDFLLPLEPHADALVDALDPVLFEVARSGAYELDARPRPALPTPDAPQGEGEPSEPLLDALMHAEPFARKRIGWTPWVLILLAGLTLFTLGGEFGDRARVLLREGPVTVLCMAVPMTIVWRLAVAQAQDVGGEPFLLIQGISVWPTILMRWALIGLAFSFLWIGRKRVAAHKKETVISMCSDIRVEELGRGTVAVLAKDASDYDKVQHTRLQRTSQLAAMAVFDRKSLLRMWVLGAILFTGAEWLLHGNMYMVPARSVFSRVNEQLSFHLSLAAIVMTAAFVMEAIGRAQRLLTEIAKKDAATQYAGPELWNAANELGVPQEHQDDVDAYLDVKITAEQTADVERYLVWPFALFVLFIASHLELFDDWHYPWQLIAFGLTLGGTLLYFAARLRSAAEKVRVRSLERMARATTALVGNKDQADRRERLLILSSRVENLRRGIFAPWSQRPVIRAVLVPFGGAGAIALLDLFATFGV